MRVSGEGAGGDVSSRLSSDYKSMTSEENMNSTQVLYNMSAFSAARESVGMRRKFRDYAAHPPLHIRSSARS